MQLKLIIDYFVPLEYHRGNNLLRRARTVVGASLITSVFAVYYALHSTLTAYWAGAVNMSIMALVFFITPFLLRFKWINLGVAGWIFISGTVVSIIGSLSFSGGFFSMVYPWLITLPIFAIMTVGVRGGQIMTAFATISMIVVWWFSFGESNFFPNQVPEQYRDFWYLSSTMGVLLIMYAIALVFHQAKTKTLEEIEEQHSIIEKQNEALEETNNIKDRIFTILGHDLKIPAASFQEIAAKVNALLKKEAYDELNQLGEGIEQSAFAMNATLDNLLQWALVKKGIHASTPREVYLLAVVEEIMTMFKNRADEKGVMIINETDQWTKLYADLHAVSTILRNLMDNMLQLSSESDIISISASETRDFIELKVSNTGKFIAEKELANFFNLYVESEWDKVEERNMGLGRFLVAELMQLNNGKVMIENIQGGGNVCKLLFPKAVMLS